MVNTFKALSLAILMLTGAPASALENFEFYRGIRSLGMGGAAIAVVNDETALAVNPAGLGKLRNFFGTVFDPELEMNSFVQSAVIGGKSSYLGNTQELGSLLEANPDQYTYSRMQLFPSLVVRNFGLGVLYTDETYGVYSSEAATLDILSRTDTSALLGYSFRFWDGRIKLGLTGKYILREITAVNDLDMTSAPDLQTLERSGTGLGFDSGLLLTAPWVGLPTLAVVARDIGGTSFTADSGIAPETMEQRVDVGFSVSPIHGKTLRSQWSIEYKDALDTEEGSPSLHYGAEFNFADVVFARLGFYQNSWTAGGEFATEFFQIQFATYAVDIGDEQTSVEDRRYAVKLGMRF